ncbi:MAG: hypothetical protein WBW92_09050 [Rhodanobacteraceae bacterium]
MSTEHSQLDDMRLAGLYRQLGDAGLPAWLDADTLVAHAAGELPPAMTQRVQQAVDASPELKALSAGLAELAPHAEMLAQSLASHGQHQTHRRTRVVSTRHAERRQAHHIRARWAGAAAAVFLAIAGVWSWQHFDAAQPTATASQQPVVTPKTDAIFDSGMDSRLAASPKKAAGDSIFRASFNRKSS